MNRLGVILAVVVFAGMVAWIFLGRPKPEPLQRAGFSLTVPSGWRVLTNDEGYDPDHRFTLASSEGGRVQLDLDDEPADAAFRIQKITELLQKAKPLQSIPFGHWGNYDGRGVELRDSDSDPMVRRIFIHSGASRSFTVTEIVFVSDQKKSQSARDQIASSFRFVDHVTVGHD